LERRFDRKLWLSYSTVEICQSVNEVRNEILAKCLAKYPLPNGVEIHSISEVPGNSGLGSSGAFIVATLTLLNALNGKEVSRHDLAELACRIEMVEMGRASGKQDQYASACGGIMCMELDRDGRVAITPLHPDPIALKGLSNNFLIYYSGITRDANTVLSEQSGAIQQRSGDAVEAMQQIMEIGRRSREWIESGDLDSLGRSMHTHWEIKKSISNRMSCPEIDGIYDFAMAHGALGGKIMGAGGGGHFMFYVPPERQLGFRRRMTERGLVEMDWQFDFRGTSVVYAE
jgi:D-glycero-alpha-D-manno-heptose-7-phosphate kinase